MSRPKPLSVPTVELSVMATSEELEILAAAAQRRHLSLKDYLRLQVMALAKMAAKTERVVADALPGPAPQPPSRSPALRPENHFLRPAFLP